MIPLKDVHKAARDSASHFLFLTPHLALTSHALGCGSASGIPELLLCPGRVGAAPLLPPQLGQLLAAVSLLAWGLHGGFLASC